MESTLKKLYGKELQISDEDKSVALKTTRWYKSQKSQRTIGKEIKGHRELIQMTQAELGKLVGNKSRQYISDLENDRREVSKMMAKKLSEIFGVSVERFI